MNYTYGGMPTGFYSQGGVYSGGNYGMKNATSDSSETNLKKEEPPTNLPQESTASQHRDSQRSTQQGMENPLMIIYDCYGSDFSAVYF